jgi:hypothetical protein
MRLALGLVLAIIATVHNAGTSAQKATPEVRTLSGQWTFSAEGYVMPLSLRQDGTRVTGTLEGFHGSFPLQGDEIDLFAIGTLQPDGSLQGTLVSTVGNLTWHAERKTVPPGGAPAYCRCQNE